MSVSVSAGVDRRSRGETFRVERKAERGSRSRRGGLTDVRQNWPPLGRGGGAGGPVKEFGCNFRVMA